MKTRAGKMLALAITKEDTKFENKNITTINASEKSVAQQNLTLSEFENALLNECLRDTTANETVNEPVYDYFVPSPSDPYNPEQLGITTINSVPDTSLIELEVPSHQPSDVDNFAKECYDNKNSKKVRQRQRNKGLPYKSKTGKAVGGRKLKYLSSCRNECKQKISDEKQELVFEKYWALGSYNARVLFMNSLIIVKDKASTKAKKPNTVYKNRQISIDYSIEFAKEKIKVCKKCFLDCFGETNSFIISVIAKNITSDGLDLLDKRGSSTPSNKLPLSKLDEIRNQINRFPVYESHYCRRDTTKKYLQPGLTLTKMYELYCSEVDTPVSLSKYSQVFRELNLKIKSPKLDTCGTCDKYAAKISITQTSEEKNTLMELQTLHQKKADMAYSCKRQDKVLARENPNTKVYAFDLQQCLPTPFLRSNIAFYKRQLWTYNLTVHDLATNKPFCYMWHEGTAKRGGNEISSCLFEHLLNIPINVSNLILYSDSCAGQNKNSHVSVMFMAALERNPSLLTIDHKFLEPGHTHLECDVDHSVIERKKKHTGVKIHHPRDWMNLVASARNLNPFHVVEMQKEKFHDFADLAKEKFTWRKVNTDGEKYLWRDFRWIRYSKTNFGSIYYKYSLNEDEPFKEVNIRKRGYNAINAITDLNVIKKVPEISNEKKEDLLFLLDFISPEFHNFYKEIIDGPNAVQDIHPDILSSDEEND